MLTTRHLGQGKALKDSIIDTQEETGDELRKVIARQSITISESSSKRARDPSRCFGFWVVGFCFSDILHSTPSLLCVALIFNFDEW